MMAIKHHDPVEPVIGEQSPVRLGLIVMLVLGTAGGFGAQTWWAATTSAQLSHMERTIESLQRDQTAIFKSQADDIMKMKTQMEVFNSIGSPHVKELSGRVTEMSDRVKFMETKGSPAVTPRLETLEKELVKMREDFELHKATTPK